MTRPIWHMSAVETARAIRDGVLTSEEVVSAHTERLHSVNPAINAVVVDLSADALVRAREADRARSRGDLIGPLHGVPITIKINVDVEGQANSNGVSAFRNNIAPGNSAVVANLRHAGAIIIGLTNTPEFSLRLFTDNPLHGQTLNPWDHAITCGGSSGGAGASIAAGIGAIAHGNDIGGSFAGRRFAMAWRRSSRPRAAFLHSIPARQLNDRSWRSSCRRRARSSEKSAMRGWLSKS